MHVYDLINTQDTYRADANQMVLDVAQAMVDRNIGAVPVLSDGLLVGIFSERDLMKRVVVEGRDPGTTRVETVMTDDPLTVSPDESLETCMVLMRRHGFPPPAGVRRKATPGYRLPAGHPPSRSERKRSRSADDASLHSGVARTVRDEGDAGLSRELQPSRHGMSLRCGAA